MLGQEPIGAWGQKIKAIPLLLPRLELTGALVTSRIEIRRHLVSTDVAWLSTNCAYPLALPARLLFCLRGRFVQRRVSGVQP